ncbi:hypothetical protein ANCCAN_03520 [Ancylostoma caninum]|uniref:Uncharacterized protein n=1 Tax=Ancylostoma caninum TaxID=29170 RepID=A0A368H3F4_ANCCA|nr:hypothetical protein ANCCAN_03520 [Ancylostoma caninum]
MIYLPANFSINPAHTFDRKQTSFTVRLVKYERSPAASPEPEESLEASTVGDKPDVLSMSSPQPSNAEEKSVNGTTSNISKNGSLQQEYEVTHRSVAARCANIFFSTFLILLLLLALSIAVFERSESSDWIENTAWLSHVRHSYYEPARHVILDKYNKYFVR